MDDALDLPQDDALELQALLERFGRDLTDIEGTNERPPSAEDLTAAIQEIVHLKRAIRNRTVIGSAQGILIERYGIDSDHAFDLLVRTSQHANRKLVDICRELVETGELPEDPLVDGS